MRPRSATIPVLKGSAMWRLKLFLVIGGGVLGYLGFQEYDVSRGTTEEPLPVELAELEKGNVPSNAHLKIGQHWQVYPHSVYTYEEKRGQTGEPGPSTKVQKVFYPILSDQHPYVLKIAALETEYGGLAKVPPEKWPTDLGKVAVLVKSFKFNKIGDIPDSWEGEASIEGLVVNRIDSIKDDEAQLLAQSFSGFNKTLSANRYVARADTAAVVTANVDGLNTNVLDRIADKALGRALAFITGTTAHRARLLAASEDQEKRANCEA